MKRRFLVTDGGPLPPLREHFDLPPARTPSRLRVVFRGCAACTGSLSLVRGFLPSPGSEAETAAQIEHCRRRRRLAEGPVVLYGLCARCAEQARLAAELELESDFVAHVAHIALTELPQESIS